MSRSAMSKPRGAGDRFSDYFMCGLRSFALHKWMDAINLQTQGSPDLLPTFRSLAMSDSLRQSERLYENWRKLFAKKHSPLLSSPFLLLRPQLLLPITSLFVSASQRRHPVESPGSVFGIGDGRTLKVILNSLNSASKIPM